MTRKILETEFERFRQTLLADADEDQIKTARYTFFCGACAAMAAVSRQPAINDTPARIASRFRDLLREVRMFQSSIKKLVGADG